MCITVFGIYYKFRRGDGTKSKTDKEKAEERTKSEAKEKAEERTKSEAKEKPKKERSLRRKEMTPQIRKAKDVQVKENGKENVIDTPEKLIRKRKMIFKIS
jgi:hypothetical protein